MSRTAYLSSILKYNVTIDATMVLSSLIEHASLLTYYEGDQQFKCILKLCSGCIKVASQFVLQQERNFVFNYTLHEIALVLPYKQRAIIW